MKRRSSLARERKKTKQQKKKETPDKTEKTEKDRVTENTALPIGAKLDILDQQLTFDQQISRLDQGIGSTANRLTMDETPSEEEEPEIYFPFQRNAAGAKRQAYHQERCPA